MLPAMARDRYLDRLAQVSLFAACSQKDLRKVADGTDEVSVEAGRVLMEQGRSGREAFIILEGTATVTHGDRTVATLGPGDYMGELSLLDQGPRTATVTAETPMRLLVLTWATLTKVIDDVPALGQKLLAVLASRMRELDRSVFG